MNSSSLYALCKLGFAFVSGALVAIGAVIVRDDIKHYRQDTNKNKDIER